METAEAGQVVLARMEPNDGELLGRFFGRLSRETVYRRFFSPLARPEQTHPERLLDLDQHDRVALVGLDGGEVVGVARYSRPAGAESAEIAVVVADDWQGQGLGTRLLRALAEAAFDAGIRRFSVTIQADNRPARELIQSLDPSVRFDFAEGVLEGTVALPLGSRAATALSDEARFQLLRQVPELMTQPDGELRGLLRNFDEAVVAKGTLVAAEGRLATQFVVVAEGSLVDLSSSGRLRLNPGSSAGFTAMRSRAENQATLVAGAPTRLLVMGRAQFRAVSALKLPPTS